MKWCLDMPCLTDVYLTEKAFKHIKFVTIIGGTHFIPLSWIDIGALQRHLRGGKRRYHLTIRVWNDGNPIWIMETRSSDCYLQTARNARHLALLITHVASLSQWEPMPNHSSLIPPFSPITPNTIILHPHNTNNSTHFPPQNKHNIQHTNKHKSSFTFHHTLNITQQHNITLTSPTNHSIPHINYPHTHPSTHHPHFTHPSHHCPYTLIHSN